MLRFHTATSGTAVKNYFSTSDYYTQGQETIGRFGGELGKALGLTGPVDKQRFDLLCDNRKPDGSPLTPRTNAFRRVGVDMIFSLPKDVGSFVMLLPDSERDAMLARIGERAEQVMGLIEADVETRVRRGMAFENRPGSGLAWAGFLHTTARPVDGMPPDPHPHWHLFAFNATKDPVEQRIKAADFANVHRDRAYFEAVFYSLVARDFAGAGYPIERREANRWGLAGLKPLGQLFSKRTGEIEEEAKRLNVANQAEKAQLGAKTRGKKQKELTPEELRAAWQGQLRPGDRQAFDAVQARELPADRRVTPKEAVAFALAHLSERQSVFPERELVRVALLHGIGQVTPEAIREELPRQGVILQEHDGRLMATTTELQREEDFIVAQAHPAQGVAPVGVPEGLSRELSGGKQLNDGQWQAVQSLLKSAYRVNLIEGPAGAGKSSLLAKFDEGMRLAGQNVTYLATTAKATEVLQQDGFNAHTLARFLVDRKMQEAARGGRVVVDESSMLGHKDAFRLYRLADQLGLKIVHLGDPMQHGSVARGGLPQAA